MKNGDRKKRWNDDKHIDRKEKIGKSRFVTGDLAEKLMIKAERYLVEDLKRMNIANKNVIDQRMLFIKFDLAIRYANNIAQLLPDANSIYGLYGIDFKDRREKFNAAKGYCFRLIQVLRIIGDYLESDMNIQKYVDLSKEAEVIATKITNLIASDDKRKKEMCKSYLPIDEEFEGDEEKSKQESKRK